LSISSEAQVKPSSSVTTLVGLDALAAKPQSFAVNSHRREVQGGSPKCFQVQRFRVQKIIWRVMTLFV
jgi:hypothetical protein